MAAALHPRVATPLSVRDKTKAIPALESYDPDVLPVCGSCRNRDEFRPYFAKVFNLKIDDNTMRRRLRENTNNPFGKARSGRADAQAQP